MIIPSEYVILKFYEYSYYPKYNKFNNTYQAGCAICREGGSLGKKRRCYYIPANDNIFCHNCGWSGKPLKWICEVSGLTPAEIYRDLNTNYNEIDITESDSLPEKIKSSTLPVDCINLFDQTQIDYYKNNDVIRLALQLLKGRRLDTAINKPHALYLSLKDNVHKNRLIIPFVNERNEIEFYQSRTILSHDKKKPKYLSRVNAERTLFNLNRVDINSEFVYIFEGPIDAFFTKNSVAVAGINEGTKSLTPRQQEQYDNVLRLQTKIWVLDSQWLDDASLTKTKILLEQGAKVFIWPEKIGKLFKDFNDIAIAGKKNEIKESFIQKNTYEGITGILRLSEVARSRN